MPASGSPIPVAPAAGSPGPASAVPAVTSGVRSGQVVHKVVRKFERQPQQADGGPPHLDNRWLFPETQVVESWSVADDRGRVSRAVASTRDADGQLIVQTVIDESGQLTSYDARFHTTTTLTTPERGRIEDVGRRPTSLQELRAKYSGKN